jgi:hypothetical protein
MSTTLPGLKIETKTAPCKICKEHKPLTEQFFKPRSRDRSGNVSEWRNTCKVCESKQSKELRNLKKIYDKSLPSNYACPICNRTEEQFETYKKGVTCKHGIWVLDHDHKTGKYRGHICQFCNTALSRFEDNPETLKRAIEYLNATL